MKIRLWHRLFLALGILSVAALAAFYVLQQRAFQSGFLGYLNQISMERLENAAVMLGKRYSQEGDWRFVRGMPRVFHNFLDGNDGPLRLPPDGLPPVPLAADDMKGPPADQRDRPPRDGRPPHDGPPPKDAPADGGLPDERRAPQRRAPDQTDFYTLVLLIDDKSRVVVGNPEIPLDSPAVSITSNGAVVGRLLLAPVPTLRRDVDVTFARAQSNRALLTASAVLIGALFFAWILARWLLSPIKALGSGARTLAAGDYTIRIDESRSDELGELANDFNRLAEALEKNRVARRDWGADIAHELRTPLAILRGEIQALQDGVRPLNVEAMASLQAECDRLTALVQDLYQLSMSDAGALEYRFDTLDLRHVLSDVVEEHTRALQGAGLKISLLPMPNAMVIRADERRLAQLFTNLLTNAQRYTDAPGEVRIEAKVENQQCIVHVDDTPPGVANELLPRLFERLFRVEASRNRAAGGAGLGLAICKNIAEAHGGSIAASASPLGGLRITLSLPVGK